MSDPVQFGVEFQRELFAILEEFFQRATGQSPDEFASIDSFPDVIRKSAEKLVPRAENAYPWVEENLRKLQADRGPDMFTAAKNLGGLKLVLGGSSRFLGTHLDAVRASLLYADTILIPDPVMPWLETERMEERFQHVLFLQAAFVLSRLKPLVDADLPYPSIMVFPSWEKLLEDNDPQTQKNMFQLIANVMANYVDSGIQSIEDVFQYVAKFPAKFLDAVDKYNLFVSPGGDISESLDKVIEGYQEEMKRWRTDDWLAKLNMLSTEQLVLNGIIERLAPQYHLLENSEELNSHPLLCVEQQAHYHRLIANTNIERLSKLSLLDKKTSALLEALGSQKLKWLSNAPIEALVELRKNNENAEFRQRLKSAIDWLHNSALDETDRVVTEVCHEISAITSDHDRQLREIQSKYNRKFGETAIIGWTAAVSTFIPALAPAMGVVAPLALATKYASDKISERAEKKQLSKSLMGILAVAKENSS